MAAFGYGVRRAIGKKGEEAPAARRAERTVVLGRTLPGARRGGRRNRRSKD